MKIYVVQLGIFTVLRWKQIILQNNREFNRLMKNENENEQNVEVSSQ